MFKNEKGAVGAMEVGGIAIFILIVGFVAFRITSADDQVNKSAVNTVASSDSPVLDEKDKLDGEEEIEVEKKEEEIEEQKKIIVEEEEPELKKEEETEDKKKDITYIEFTNSSASQDGTTVSINATLESAQTGTCHLKFWRDGYQKVYTSQQLNNSKECSAEFDSSEFEIAGTWEIHVWFNSDDGKVEAYNANNTFDVTL